MDCSSFYPTSDGLLTSTFLRHSMAANPNASVVISPISITILLAMLHGGARPKTKTNRQLSNLLTTDKDASQRCVALYYGNVWQNLKTDPALKVATGVYVDRQFKLTDKYRAIVEKVYRATVRELELSKRSHSSAKLINADIANQTDQQIKEILSAGDLRDARMVLTSAATFFAEWKTKFNPKLTSKKKFYPLNQGPAQQVETMINMYESIPYYEDKKNEFKMIGLPYEGSKVTMYLLLTNRLYDIDQLLAQMSQKQGAYGISSWIQKAKPQRVAISLPKFKINTSLDVKQMLNSMGVYAPFNCTDFKDISDGESQLQVSNFREKAFIDVNEKGTKAGVATVAVAWTRSSSQSFKADHPFAFFLTINTRNGPQILLSGVVASIDPTDTTDQKRLDGDDECKTARHN